MSKPLAKAHRIDLPHRPADCAVPYLQEICSRIGTRPVPLCIEACCDSMSEDRKPYDVAEGVAIIDIAGHLSQRPKWYNETSYDEIRSELEMALTDDSVESILLNINSPGGETDGAFELCDYLADCGKQKRIWAVANGSAYSGAYLLASQTEMIYVPQTTGGVGSIGVFSLHTDLSDALKKAGINITLLSAGEGKTDGNPFEPLSKQARANLMGEINRLYAEFTMRVARGRKMSERAVRDLGAHLYQGSLAALGAGLADVAGTQLEAWYALAQMPPMMPDDEKKKKMPMPNMPMAELPSAPYQISNFKFISSSVDTPANSMTASFGGVNSGVATASAASHQFNNDNTDEKEGQLMAVDEKTRVNANAGAADANTDTGTKSHTGVAPPNPATQQTQGQGQGQSGTASAAIAVQSQADIDASLRDARSAGRNAYAKEVSEITALCQLAGHPNMVTSFLGEGISVDKVREKLLALKAEENRESIDSHFNVSKPRVNTELGGDRLITVCEKLGQDQLRSHPGWKGGAR